MSVELGPAVDFAISTFPTQIEDFQTDPRIAWSRVSGKWTLEAEDGSEYEYDDTLKRWILVLDVGLAEEQAKIYTVEGTEDNEPVNQPRNKKKRKVYTSTDSREVENEGAKRPRNVDGKRKDTPKTNKAVYVTNIPHDATETEIQEVFSKCGVIAEEIDSGKPRIKLYRDSDGSLKGDALVVYFRPESVDLAIQMLDDTCLRPASQSAQGKMHVQAADFSYKAQQDTLTKQSSKEKRKVIKKTQKLNSKLADWDDDEPIRLGSKPKKPKKTVILKHMFAVQELEDDPAAILDLKEDIREECEKIGEVTNVVLYDKEEEGVVSVRFKDEVAAASCVAVMNGRYFDQKTVEAFISDGSEVYRKSTSRNAAGLTLEEEERLERFGSWLENDQTEKT